MRVDQKIIVTTHFLLFCLVITLTGCISVNTTEQPAVIDVKSKELDYDYVSVELIEPLKMADNPYTVNPDAGAKDGFKMMLAAPVGCMQTGMLYGFCVAMAPVFPFLTANQAQDPEIVKKQLESVASRLHDFNIPEQLHVQLVSHAESAQLLLIEPKNVTTNSLRARLLLETLQLSHDGYKEGTVVISLPYRFELRDSTDQLLGLLEKKEKVLFKFTDPEDWQKLDNHLQQIIEKMAAEGLDRHLIEWQPRIVLTAHNPLASMKRNFLGFSYEDWSFADSISPQLKWQRLEEVLDQQTMENVTDITYEVRIRGRGKEVYKATNLSDPDHRVGVELHPCTYYYWQPIARFKYKNMPFVTSLRNRPWGKDNTLDYFYLLKTPALDCKDPRWLAVEQVEDGHL